jgi:O-antigen ligase
MTHPGLRPGWSVLGVLLIASFVAVAFSVETRTGASSRPVIVLALASAGTMAAAALVGTLHRVVVPLSVALAISWVAYQWSGDLDGGPLSGPFGYRNAFGALLLMGAFAWLIAGRALRHPIALALSIAPAGVLGFLAVRSSSAAAAGLVLVAVAFLGFLGTKGVRAAVIICWIATFGVLAVTIRSGASYLPGRPPSGFAASLADAGITERRLALWHDALDITRTAPSGIGHGRFGETSPTALSDRDTIYAHNEFLETSAELGVGAGVLMVLLIAWAFARLAVTRRPGLVAAISAAVLAGASIQACVDYVWHFPAIPLAAAALVGTGFVGRREYA